jgi:hypothetical protein
MTEMEAGAVLPAPRIPYATPEALRAAVTDRAKDAAAAQPHYSVAERQRQFAYGRLLARVFTDEPERWVLKGGAALLARLPDARHSRDVDLWGGGADLDAAERALERSASLDLGDHMSFRVGAWRRGDLNGQPLARTMVICRIGRREFARFGVDLVVGGLPPLEPEQVIPPRPVDLPGLPEVPWRLYPIAAQVADKVAGIHKRHEERPSSRYRDLVDLAEIAVSQRVAAADLHLALHSELPRQRVPVPAELAVPDPDRWAAGYNQQVRRLPVLEGIGFAEALALAKSLVDPVLAGRRQGTWLPAERRWSGKEDGADSGNRPR